MMSRNAKASSRKTPTEIDFHPLIIRKDNNFCVYVPEWRLSGEGSSLEEAYRQFERNRIAFEQRRAKFDLASVSPDPYPILKKREILQELSLFFLKTATAVAAVILVVVLLLPHARAAFRHQAVELVSPQFRDPQYWAVKVPSKLNERLDRLDPAEQELMRSEWGKLIARVTSASKPVKCQ